LTAGKPPFGNFFENDNDDFFNDPSVDIACTGFPAVICLLEYQHNTESMQCIMYTHYVY